MIILDTERPVFRDHRLQDMDRFRAVEAARRRHVSSFSGDGVSGGVAYLAVGDVDALHEELLRKDVPIHIAPPPPDREDRG